MVTAAETVLSVLEDAGFERLPKPLVVAGSTFEFDAAARGSGLSHDLVVVASELSSPRRLVRLVGGLSRALDQIESKRPVSVVVVGPALDAATAMDLERHARILTIVSEAPDPNEVRSAVAVLLPLTLPDASGKGRDPLAEVAHAVGTSLSDDHRAFIEAGRLGPDAVRETLRRYVDSAFEGDADERAT